MRSIKFCEFCEFYEFCGLRKGNKEELLRWQLFQELGKREEVSGT